LKKSDLAQQQLSNIFGTITFEKAPWEQTVWNFLVNYATSKAKGNRSQAVIEMDRAVASREQPAIAC